MKEESEYITPKEVMKEIMDLNNRLSDKVYELFRMFKTKKNK